MKPRLTVVLDLRRAAEDAAKREVGRLERERAALVAARMAHELELAVAAGLPVIPALREQLASYTLAMRQTIRDDEARIAAQDGLIGAARDALATAHREVKAIEAIRARDARVHARRLARAEGRANDEHAGRMRLEAKA